MEYHSHPREFKLIGFLAEGLECDLGDLESLAIREPTGLLVAGDEIALEMKQESVLECC